MDFPILITWMSPFSSFGASGVIFHFISFIDKNQNSKQNSLRWDATFCGVTSGAIMFDYVPLKGRQPYIWVNIWVNVLCYKSVIGLTTRNWFRNNRNFIVFNPECQSSEHRDVSVIQI